MKITLDLPDSLLRKAHEFAARECTTLTEVIERCLRRIVSERNRETPFRLRACSFGGHGLRPELRDASWDQIRSLAYEGRGGDPFIAPVKSKQRSRKPASPRPASRKPR